MRDKDPIAPVPLDVGAEPLRKVHPIATLDYPVRIAAHLLLIVVISSTWIREQPSVWAWVWLAFTGLAWPHLAYVVARRSKDSKAVELRFLLGDNAIIGGFAALIGFSLWPSATIVTAMMAANLSINGLAFAVRGAVATIAGAVLMVSLTGLTFTPDSSLLTSLLSAGGLFLFSGMLGLYSNVEARRAIRAVREVKAKSLHIEEQRRDVQRSRDLAESERAAADEARRLAEAANGAKSAFLANMSHELRTPLNAIIGYAEMLEEDSDDVQQRSDLQKIHGSGKHLLGLINDVLDLSKIEAGKVELNVEVFDVAQLIDQVASTMRPLLDKNANRFELRLQEPLGVMTSDSTRLSQVLLNLLSNAAKFTHGGEVILAVRREEREAGGWLRFEVMDSGIGMSPEQLSRLFRPFEQADASTTRTYGGTGLGLVISRRLCRMMGGDVDVTSESGHGTRFTMRLPARAPDVTVLANAFDDAVRRPAAVVETETQASRALLPPTVEEPWREVPQAQRIISQGMAAPAVFRISPDGAFLNLNPSAARLFGFASIAQLLSAVTDIGAQSFVSPAVWNDYRQRLLKDGLVSDFEYEIRHPDGSTRWLSQDACAVRGDKGTITRFECFAKDITALKRVCLALDQRLDEALKSAASPLAGIVVGDDLTFVPSLAARSSVVVGGPTGELRVAL